MVSITAGSSAVSHRTETASENVSIHIETNNIRAVKISDFGIMVVSAAFPFLNVILLVNDMFLNIRYEKGAICFRNLGAIQSKWFDCKDSVVPLITTEKY
jgi:hypothetical protein